MFPLKDNIPTRRTPVLTIALIVANIVMYFGFQKAGILSGPNELPGEPGNAIEYGAIPYELSHPGKECELGGERLVCEGQPGVTGEAGPQPPTVLTLFTSMFMHGGILHIAGNMLFLWIFGNNVEDSMGRVKFILFYVLGGLAALAAQTIVNPDAAVPTIGASGAVAAVLGGYLLLYPRARVVTVVFLFIFFTFLELPAVVMLGLWFLIQLLYGTAELAQPVAGGGGGVAYFAHIGGFVFGLLLIKLFADRRRDDYVSRSRFPVY